MQSRNDNDSPALHNMVVKEVWCEHKGRKYPYMVQPQGKTGGVNFTYRVPFDTDDYVKPRPYEPPSAASVLRRAKKQAEAEAEALFPPEPSSRLISFAEIDQLASATATAARYTEKARVSKMMLPNDTEDIALHEKLLKSKDKISQHVILVLDASKSMAKKDAYSDESKQSTRLRGLLDGSVMIYKV